MEVQLCDLYFESKDKNVRPVEFFWSICVTVLYGLLEGRYCYHHMLVHDYPSQQSCNTVAASEGHCPIGDPYLMHSHHMSAPTQI
eukprot:5425893-Amphidinium_carterae.1